MIPIDQTIMRGTEGPVRGNCLQACVASVLELPLDDVPHFAMSPDWLLDMDRFLARFGLGVLLVRAGADWNFYADELPYLVAGKSPRGDWLHSVIFAGGKMIHDPHPSREGFRGGPVDFILFIPRTAEGIARLVREAPR